MVSTGIETAENRIGLAGMTLALTLIGVQHLWLRDLKFDDAWIHFRYAANVAAGHGLVYNEGQRILGSGGIAWDLLLGVLAWVWGPSALSALVSIFNYAASVGCAVVLAGGLRAYVPPWLALLVATAVLVQGPLVVSSIGGMETTLLCLLYFRAFVALQGEWFVLAGICSGLAVCVRIESLPMIAISVAGAARYRPHRIARVAAAASCLPALSFLWTWAYFGSPVATSTIAKGFVFFVPPQHALYESFGALLNVLPFHRFVLVGPAFPLLAHWLGIAAWAITFAQGVRAVHRTSPAAALVALQPLAAIAFYAAFNPQMFVWYQCTFVPLATVFALLGLIDLVRRGLAPRFAPNVVSAVLICALSVTPVWASWTPFVPPNDPRFSVNVPNARQHARTYQYAHVASWLNDRSHPTDRVCISEIGTFGFHYRGRILDGLGLVSPEVFPYHPLPVTMRRSGLTGAIPPQAVRAFTPEFVVSLDVFAEALFADPWFLQHYELIGSWPWFGGPVRWHDLPPAVLGGKEIRAYGRIDRAR